MDSAIIGGFFGMVLVSTVPALLGQILAIRGCYLGDLRMSLAGLLAMGPFVAGMYHVCAVVATVYGK